MVSSDTVVGIVGAVILTGAMIAVFYYENTTADGEEGVIGTGSNVYTFRFNQTEDVSAKTDSFTLNPDQDPRTTTFTLPAYVYDLHAHVTWTVEQDPLGGVDPIQRGTVKATLLTNEGKKADEKADDSGEHMLGHAAEDHDHNETQPPQETVRVAGNSTEAARANLQQNLSSEHGVGEWKLVIEVTEPGGHQGSDTRGRDQQIRVDVTYSYWEPKLVE